MHVLGIDGGGSQTRALLCDASGRSIGQGLSGGTNPRATSLEDVRAHLQEAIAQAIEGTDSSQIVAAHLGIAGAGDAEASAKIAPMVGEILGAASATTVGHDLEIALVGGLGGEAGVALVAGTGSACYGRSALGRSAECGGWGDLVDDAGSGNWIGLRALQVCVRQADGRLPESPLKQAVMHFLGIESMDAFKARIHDTGLSRSERAKIAPIILDLAASGDRASAGIVSEGIDDLCSSVISTSRQLEIAEPKILLTGGLTQHRYFRDLLKTALMTRIPAARITQPILSPTEGAVLLALTAAGIQISEDTIETLNKASHS